MLIDVERKKWHGKRLFRVDRIDWADYDTQGSCDDNFVPLIERKIKIKSIYKNRRFNNYSSDSRGSSSFFGPGDEELKNMKVVSSTRKKSLRGRNFKTEKVDYKISSQESLKCDRDSLSLNVACEKSGSDSEIL